MIAIIEYQSGNVRSVANALNRLGVETVITADHQVIQTADKVIFPGVGHADAAMQQIRANNLEQLIINLKQPVLGICLGLQLMCQHTEEGEVDGLGIFNTVVKRFPADLKVPHMGWNNLTYRNGPLFKDLTAEDDMYFVHSYYAEINNEAAAHTAYHLDFASALQKDNFYAVQFHPEKSGKVGATLLQNFLNL